MRKIWILLVTLAQAFRVDLLSRNEFGGPYFGTIFLDNSSSPARVVFDTGSQNLAVTSDQCFEGCHTQAYKVIENQSNQQAKQIQYGSALFQGTHQQDQICLTKMGNCVEYSFLAATQFKGLEKYLDGIMGMTPKSELLLKLKNSGLISEAVVSFSLVSQKDFPNLLSYAQFGSINHTQIHGSIQTFKNQGEEKWQIPVFSLISGNISHSTNKSNTSAIFDSGSQMISLPSSEFTFLQSEWNKSLPKTKSHQLDCSDELCKINMPCTSVQSKVRSVTIQLQDSLFEMKPSAFLRQIGPAKCMFTFQRLPDDVSDIILGDTFLQHFYSSYDFEKKTISLGVNINSKEKVFLRGTDKRKLANTIDL